MARRRVARLRPSPEQAARRLAHSCARVLGPSLVSAILHGSAVTGDFRPGRSDLDLILVVDRHLSPDQAAALTRAVGAADPSPAAGVDLLVVTVTAARDPARHPARELAVWRPGTPCTPGAPGPAGTALEVDGRDDHVPDLWPELSEARTIGRSLLGAEPHSILAEVPAARVHDNGLHWLRTWLGRPDDAEHAVHMVLTACRIWHFAGTGRHLSKSAAARWALTQDGSLSAVATALAAHEAGEAPQIAPDEVARVLHRALEGAEAGR